MKTLMDAACAHLAAPGIAEPFLARALGGIVRVEAVADELRAELHRRDAQQAQLAMEVARLRNLLDGLETAVAALGATLEAQVGSRPGDARKCQSPSSGLICAKCGGMP